MRKSPEQKFIDSTLKRQRAASENARLAYEESHNPQIVIDYIRKSQSGAAINEPWVNAIIISWMRYEPNLLKKAFSNKRGRNETRGKKAIEEMMFMNRIDNYRMTGQSLGSALISELQRSGNGDLAGEALDKARCKLKNRYDRAKKIRTEVTVQETPDTFIITAFPAKITCDAIDETGGLIRKDISVFGEWSITYPKK